MEPKKNKFYSKEIKLQVIEMRLAGTPENTLSELEKLIIDLCKKNKYRYGHRKITFLVNKTHKANKNTVQRVMQKHKLNCKVRPKKRNCTGQPLQISNNIINVDFKAVRPLEKLLTDITYLPFGQSMLYLSSIMDLYNREIIAYTISDKQDLACVLDTLKQLPNLIKPSSFTVIRVQCIPPTAIRKR